MMEESAKWVTSTVKYPSGILTPTDFLRFVQVGTFEDDWKRLGLTDDELQCLEVFIMAAPEVPPERHGTGGLREGQLVVRDRNMMICVGYVHYPDTSVVTLVYAYNPKEESGSISVDEAAEIKLEIERTAKYLGEGV